MEVLKDYYNEHASQARQHEDQRERITNIILSIAGVLVGLITFSELSVWSLFASISIILLGLFGFFFSGKHYERFKFHTSIMKSIRDEIDNLAENQGAVRLTLRELRTKGECNHYKEFTLPKSSVEKSKCHSEAKSWIARQRVHVFWESIHILVVLIGFGLTVAVIIKYNIDVTKEPIKVEIVNR